jgi:hypothetical protein
MIRVELHPDVLKALDVLPQPKAAARDSRLFFSSGNASVRSLVKGAQRTLAAVFVRAKVAGGHPHIPLFTLPDYVEYNHGRPENNGVQRSFDRH